jgi:hypothetical protein
MLLLERTRLNTFKATLKLLHSLTENDLELRSSNPLVPTAFATIDANFPSWEVVEGAWHTLQLGARATATEIRSSYFRLAHELRPDAKSADAQIAAMEELASAHRLLMGCAKTAGTELMLHGSQFVALQMTQS